MAVVVLLRANGRLEPRCTDGRLGVANIMLLLLTRVAAVVCVQLRCIV